MSFADITVVGITGADSYTEGTMYAIIRSCAELHGSRGLLISPSCPQGLPEISCISLAGHSVIWNTICLFCTN